MIGSYILVAFIAFIVGAAIGGCYFDTFKIGAEWMQKEMIDKACKWLINIDFDDYDFRDCDESFNNDLFIDAFRKAMEK